MVDEIKKKKTAHGKPPTWFKLEAYFSREDGLEPAVVDGIPVLIPGKLGDVPVIQIPASSPPEVFDRLSKALVEAGSPEPFVITSNVLLFSFQEITDREARAIMDETKAKLEKIGAERDAIRLEEEGPQGEDADGGAPDGGDPVADGDGGDGDGSEPDGVVAGDVGAGDADGAGGDGVEDPAEPGIVEEQEA